MNECFTFRIFGTKICRSPAGEDWSHHGLASEPHGNHDRQAQPGLAEVGHYLPDGVPDRGVPPHPVPHRQHHLGPGVEPGQVPPVQRHGEVNAGGQLLSSDNVVRCCLRMFSCQLLPDEFSPVLISQLSPGGSPPEGLVPAPR